ncbi:MAG TPA: DUF1761 domain-containing protein [Pyrinomonadaceae bacterium]|nr:DUF1761 domain-containing protein [Pyrinomonadaceae bacterium]
MRINHVAVAASALAYWMLGAVWYTAFANPFIALMRWGPEDLARVEAEGAGLQLVAALAASLVAAYALAYFVKFTGAEDARRGALVGLLAWLGFVATTNLNTVLFEFRPAGLYLINAGYHLVGLLGTGALLAVWKRREARAPAYQS